MTVDTKRCEKCARDLPFEEFEGRMRTDPRGFCTSCVEGKTGRQGKNGAQDRKDQLKRLLRQVRLNCQCLCGETHEEPIMALDCGRTCPEACTL
ncbi:MAG: hypothetical protein ACKV2O_15465 [Acidimicrobiales bacterium]